MCSHRVTTQLQLTNISYHILHRILYQENLRMFLEDLAVSGTCVISTSLFRVSILLVAAGSQKMLLWHVL